MVDVVSRGPWPRRSGAGTELDTEALDRAVADVAANVSRWAATDARQRARLLDAVLVDTLGAADAWLADACEAKGFDVGSPESGRSCSRVWGPSCAWRACCVTHWTTSRPPADRRTRDQ